VLLFGIICCEVNVPDDNVILIDYRLLVKDKKERINAEDALQHPWLRTLHPEIDEDLISQRSIVIPTTRHRKFHLASKENDLTTVRVSLGRYAAGGSIRSLTGKSVAKVKIEPVDVTPHLMPMYHVHVKEGDDAKITCRIAEAEHDEKITW